MLLQLAAVAVKPLWKKILPSPLFLMNFIPISSFYFLTLCVSLRLCESQRALHRLLFHGDIAGRASLSYGKLRMDGTVPPSRSERSCLRAEALPLSVAAEMIKNRLAFFGKSAVEVWISFVGFMKHKKETTRSAQKRVVSAFTATTLESGGLFFLSFLFYFCSIPVFP